MLQSRMENTYINFNFEKIEFNVILEEIKKYCLTEKCKEYFDNITILNDFEKIVRLHKLLSLLINYFIEVEILSFDSLFDFSNELNDVIKGRTVDPVSLYRIAYSVNLYFNLRRKFDNEKFFDIKNLFSIEKIDSTFYKDVLKHIDSNGYVSSSASKDLSYIRNRLSHITDSIKKTTENYFKKYNALSYTSDEIVTIKNNYYCIAIKATYKNRVKGIVIDSSNSGQTFYIIPDEVFSLYNEYQTLLEDEKREIFRICREYTEILRQYIDSIKIIENELLEFEILYAKARFSFEREFNSPEIIKDKFINIINGKHPLLGVNAVPLNLKLGSDFKALVITGPNTGGKSVVLKTVGLFVLMVQSGIAIPASSSSQFCVFDKVFLDIGDEQSIEQSLSTFSAHIKKIKYILENSDSNSLILLDEFCSGTDPMEGSALAIAVLDKIVDIGSLTIVTTHYFSLKVYASEKEGVENGSMEFDTEKLTPTYKLQIGVPGSSKALDISKRLGLSNELIEKAYSNLNKDYVNVQLLLDKLEKETLQLNNREKIITELEDKLTKEKDILNTKQIELKEKEKKLNDILKTKESLFLTEARKELENIVKTIRDSNASKESIHIGKNFIKKLEEHLKTEETEFKAVRELGELNIGDEVLVLSKNVKGIVIAKTNIKDRYLIQTGLLKVEFNRDELKKIKEESENKRAKDFNYSTPKNSSFSFVLDIRGVRYEEAENRIEKFIENAIVNKVKQVKVIHGIGTGVIRQCLHEYCKRDKRVLNFEYEKRAESNSTNFGVTVIYLNS